ncbi:alpha-glycosidase (plasmid) [Pontibacillus sp. ALD_SL1]|uniref:glycoside hydrolase family 13 protein n=1 Tax=Pontibacillus sp. ALD_SL1 TaxID=2777185 RepID=UPI001A963043|nr:glycoside hydrolase family 13 protein [Pontibacillus sp. ALD_SL1]QST02787.1 alpha-glycosidase [Pontibacillus sp. ALD_SL1]
MEVTSLYHQPKNHYAYPLTTETVHLRFQSKKGDVETVLIHAKDPFTWEEGGWVSVPISMTKIGSDEWLDYWQADVSPPFRRLEYHFEVKGYEKSVYFTEGGVFLEEHHMRDPFKFPFINEADVFTPPRWVKNTVWYQIFPERFYNGNPDLSPDGVVPWDSEPTPDHFMGGDLEGVIQKLDYLKELGITGLYFCPIFEAASNHKYDTTDYKKIDPHFGDTETLRTLVQEAHKRGMRIMLDAVFNHSGYYFPPFQDVLKNGKASLYYDWFYIQDESVVTDPPNYDTFAFTGMMPKLRTSNPEVRDYLLEVARYWIETCDIDGWRLDVANEVDHAFWRDFRRVVKGAKPDAYILGEIWHNSMPWLRGDQFDAVMNYPFTNLVLDLAGSATDGESFIQRLHKLRFSYPDPVHAVSFNMLGSHDTERVLTRLHHDKRRVKLAYFLLLTYTGSPCVYYGDEIGMHGYNDPGCRKGMIWAEEKQDREMRDWMTALIRFRAYNGPLYGQGERIYENGGLLYIEGSKTIIINPTDHHRVVASPEKRTKNVFGEVHYDGISFHIPPFGFVVLEEEK